MNKLFYFVLIGLLGNLIFIIETWCPLGNLITEYFGSIGSILGSLLAWWTILVDSALISMLVLIKLGIKKL